MRRVKRQLQAMLEPEPSDAAPRIAELAR
jgi:hypothetical protein